MHDVTRSTVHFAEATGSGTVYQAESQTITHGLTLDG
jgi:hypothetical protein